MEFEGKSVIVTGAGKGIGRQTARRLAAEGAEVVAISRTRADLDSLAKEIGGRGVAVDLADASATRRAVAEILPADFLVNCAGINILQPFLEIEDANFDLVQAVNLRAPMIVSQLYARDRIARGQPGAIVNVSSISAFTGFQDHASYCASKGGLDGMTRVMANELGRHGIRVNAINPTVTMTDLAAAAWSDPAKSGPMMARIPLGRFAETDDVADLVLFLLSDRASMLNGLSVPLDGGFLAD
ncbi:SDR family oxidoreductase [Consotaella aegiceratis]|uniref:SDR family oxidoreductase n=1 Tax=Consotaella aegiceratis TaxID=3097961 RepID=UPI002F40F13B